MTGRLDRPGPRIYNLFPLLCGPIDTWHKMMPRIADMGFRLDIHQSVPLPGVFGQPLRRQRLLPPNPLIRGEASGDDAALIADFAGAARRHGLAVMMDLVINHTASDSLLTEEHPEWFAREPDGSIRSPLAIDPTDASNVTIWGDLAEIDYVQDRVRAATVPILAGGCPPLPPTRLAWIPLRRGL